MSAPVVHVIAGPNGAGKSTFATRILQPATHLPLVNADIIAAERWPDSAESQAYEAARLAERQRQDLLSCRSSFITETVFSHPSKVTLVQRAGAAGYQVRLHVIMIPADLAPNRVSERVRRGGHSVPERKIGERFERLWRYVADARRIADRTEFYDNSRASTPFKLVAAYQFGRPIREPAWPSWTPAILVVE